MSFWNFLGELAIFNMIRNWLSNKSNANLYNTPYQNHTYAQDTDYDANVRQLQREIKNSKNKIAEYKGIIGNKETLNIDEYDADELQVQIDELEDQLDQCDVSSHRYDVIQDKLDMLQERMDEIDDLDMYDVLHDDFDNLYMDDIDTMDFDSGYMDFDRDDDW